MAIGQVSGKISPTISNPSVSGASGPSTAAPSVNYSESKLGEGQIKTIKDGTTKITTTVHEKGDDISRGARQAFFNQHGKWPPCINTSCRSYGRPHPNCACFGPMSQSGNFEYAHGGCVGSHNESCEHFATGGEIEFNEKHFNDPGYSLDHYAAHKGLLGILKELGHNGRSQNAHKYAEEYVDGSMRGQKTIDGHIKNLIGKEKLNIEPNPEHTSDLKKHLEFLNQNPDQALSIGGNLEHVFPGHGSYAGSRAANALNYLNTLKPKSFQNSPLDPISPPGKAADAQYNRQLEIAENPKLILEYVKSGTVQPLDLTTVKTLYPDLFQSIVSKSGEALIDAKNESKFIPYRQKQGLSSLMGQPLDSLQTPMAMQAIMRANAGAQQQSQNQGKPKKASGVELKQIDKTNDLLATQSQTRLLDKKQ